MFAAYLGGAGTSGKQGGELSRYCSDLARDGRQVTRRQT